MPLQRDSRTGGGTAAMQGTADAKLKKYPIASECISMGVNSPFICHTAFRAESTVRESVSNFWAMHTHPLPRHTHIWYRGACTPYQGGVPGSRPSTGCWLSCMKSSSVCQLWWHPGLGGEGRGALRHWLDTHCQKAARNFKLWAY